MIAAIRSFARDTRGATAVEYSLIASLVVVVLLVGLGKLGDAALTMWSGLSDAVAGEPQG